MNMRIQESLSLGGIRIVDPDPGQSSQCPEVFNVAYILDHRHEQGWHGRPGFVSQQPVAGSAAAGQTTTTAAPKKRVKRFLGKTTTTTTVRPIVAQQNILTSLTTPPFLFESIEAVIEGVEACKPYIFTLKIYSPRNAVMGEIEG